MRRLASLAALALLFSLPIAAQDAPPPQVPKDKPEDDTAGNLAKTEAMALLNQGKLDEAKERLKKRIKENTEDFDARTLLGRIHVTLGELKTAEEQFRKVMENSEPATEARGRLAELMYATGRYEEGTKLAEETLAKDPAALNARVALGSIQLEIGKGDDAEKTLGWFSDYVTKTQKLTGMQKFTSARGLWLLALRKGDKDLIHMVVDGDALLNEALGQEDTPDDEVLAFWGHCYADKYQGVYAKHCFDDALKLNAKCASAIFGMARIVAEAGQIPQAMGALTKALEINDKLFDALLLQAALQGQQQQYDPSQATLDKALKINPKSVQALAIRAANYELAGKKEEREKVEAELKTINPNCGLAFYLIGQSIGNKMLFDEAQVYLKKAVEADPKLWDAYTEYGMNALRLGDEVTALKYLTEAYERDPFNIRLFNTMTLMDAFPKEFVVVETKHFRIRMHKKEVDIIGPYVCELHERCWDEMVRRYHFEPQVPIVSDMYPNQNDFSVRTVGTSGLGALGACFGKMVTLLSPRAKEVMGKFNWGSVVWHELGHVWALQISKNRVPRWFTEGLSTYEESQGYPGWDRELEVEIFNAYHAKKLMKINQLGAAGDLLNLYLWGSLIHTFIVEKWGFESEVKMLHLFAEGKDAPTAFQTVLGVTPDQFDVQINTWLGEWLKRAALRMPFKATPEEAKKLQQAINDDPMDADSMGKLARILEEAGQHADAEMLAKKALKIDEANGDALIVIAKSMGTAERRRFDKAAENYKKAIDGGATDFQTRWQYALMLLKADKEDDAIKALEEAKAVFPRYIGSDNPYAKLIEIYDGRKDEDNKLKQMEQLLKIDHDTFKLRIDAAEIYQKRGDRAKVIQTLESAIYIGVFDSKLHAWLGRAYRDGENWQRALHEFKCCVIMLQEAEAAKPGKWGKKIGEFQAEQANCAMKLGKLEDARNLAKEAILADPENALGRKLLEELNK
ncbi:MAG: tetratricopeptide repeat protein [Planctomycetes bacterium]|nr:tetratricopeptide repeat protein [Planctomycetota bacterium]